MGLNMISIGSSSAGNSYLVTDGCTHLLLDVGLSAKRIREGLAQCGIAPQEIRGIFVTHEHLDHVKSIRAVAKTCAEAAVYTSRGTAHACDKFEYVPEKRLHHMASQDRIAVGDISVRAFSLSHDAAEPLGFTFTAGGEQLTMVTDTGIVTDEIEEEIRTADKLVLEANHEVNILEMGPYPYSVKRRILGDRGHLSNVATGVALAKMLTRKRSAFADRKGDLGAASPRILLAHLSSQNNTPEQAELTVRNILKENEFADGADFRMAVAARNETTELE